MNVLMDGLQFTESPRWHEGRLWFSDWAAGQVHAVALDGHHEVVASIESFPLCFDFLPDGSLLLVDSAKRRLLRQRRDGSQQVHAELGALSTFPWNDIVVDRHGTAWVNNIGYDFPTGEPAPGIVVRVPLEGEARVVAEGLSFPNGMAVTDDDGTLLVAESHASRITAYPIEGDALGEGRPWALTGDDHPDGICLDATGAVWFADVGNRHCVRIVEGGERLEVVDLDRGAFACALSRGPEPRLFVVGQEYGGDAAAAPTGQVVWFPAPAPGAGRP